MCSAPAYSCEEAIFGEDGNGIEEEDGDIDQWSETEKREHSGKILFRSWDVSSGLAREGQALKTQGTRGLKSVS
jgi:hypothetical protein